MLQRFLESLKNGWRAFKITWKYYPFPPEGIPLFIKNIQIIEEESEVVDKIVLFKVVSNSGKNVLYAGDDPTVAKIKFLSAKKRPDKHPDLEFYHSGLLRDRAN